MQSDLNNCPGNSPRPIQGTKAKTCGNSDASCRLPAIPRDIGTWSAWSPSASTGCRGSTVAQSRTRTCTSGSCGGASCASVSLSEPRDVNGTGEQTPRTVSGWSAYSPLPSDRCKGTNFPSRRTRTCTPGAGTCGQSCAGVGLAQQHGETGTSCAGSCKDTSPCRTTPPPDPCVPRTIGPYSPPSPARSEVCSGTPYQWTSSRTCTNGTEGSGGCAWSCAGVTLTKPPGNSTGTASRTPRTVSGWSAYSPSPSQRCKGTNFPTRRTRTCTPGAGTCGQSCAGVGLAQQHGETGTSCAGSCRNTSPCRTTPPPDPCVPRTIGGYSPPSPARSEVCSGTPYAWTSSRTCTNGTKGSGGCAWSCAGVSLTRGGNSTGTQRRTGATYGSWSAYSPLGSEVCRGVSFTSTRTRSCTQASGACAGACGTTSQSRPGSGSRPSTCGDATCPARETWSPACDGTPTGTNYTQTSNCGGTRTAEGCGRVQAQQRCCTINMVCNFGCRIPDSNCRDIPASAYCDPGTGVVFGGYPRPSCVYGGC